MQLTHHSTHRRHPRLQISPPINPVLLNNLPTILPHVLLLEPLAIMHTSPFQHTPHADLTNILEQLHGRGAPRADRGVSRSQFAGQEGEMYGEELRQALLQKAQ